MKHYLTTLFAQAFAQLQQDGIVPAEVQANIQLERTRDSRFGDFACNLAMMLAKPAKRKPRELAELLIERLPSSEHLEKVEIAGPGFINLFLSPAAIYQVIKQALAEGDAFGRSQMGQGQSVLLEFVSANPTGPLHVGHGRGAAYGAALADLLKEAGFDVHREYYVNDAGRQMDILATSVWLRYLSLCGEVFDFPSNGYKGEYIKDISAELLKTQGESLRVAAAEVFADIPADEPAGGDKELHIDALIQKAQSLLNADGYETVFKLSVDTILDDIREDLSEFGVDYEEWFSERSLHQKGDVDTAIEALRERGHIYDQDGAVWFRSTDFGDEKDRVLVRENGIKTYFAPDIAYHLNKLERRFDHLINIWGADHHGYIPRVKAAVSALGGDAERLTVLLVQFATLYRGQERLQMSTRSGEFVTLRELRDEVGKDAARFFYVMRKSEQHLDFDLELAKSHSNDNPVYYIQYAHARVSSVMRGLSEQGLSWDAESADLTLLNNEHEQGLISVLSRYSEVIESAARHYEPHQVAYYLRELATAFHAYYNAHKFLIDDTALRNARLSLILATQQVLRNGLRVLGVSAPDSM